MEAKIKRGFMFLCLLTVFVYGCYHAAKPTPASPTPGEIPAYEIPAYALACQTNDDCTKIQLAPCPCSMGGKESCIAKRYADQFAAKPTGQEICIALYACQIKSCECINSKCQAILENESYSRK